MSIRRIFICLVLLFICQLNVYGAVLGKQRLAHDINNLIKKTNADINIGIQIEDLNNNKVIYTKQAKHLLMPASTQKLFTSVATLKYLGTSYHYRTYLLTDASRIKDGVVDGNIIIQFGGDPSLRYEDLEGLIQGLAETGIHQINGNVYLDDYAYKPRHIGKGWMWDDLPYCFSAPVGAMNLDHNCFSFNIRPADKAGQLAVIEPMHLSIFTPVNNKVVTLNEEKCHVRVTADSRNHYSIEGCVRHRSAGEDMEIAISNVDRYVADMVSFALEQNNISVTGLIKRGQVDKSKSRRLSVHYSKPLWQLNGEMLKESDNLYAESFLKKLGAEYYDKQGTWRRGTNAMVNILEKDAGIKLDTAKFEDGSGASRYTLVSADHLSHLLNYAYHNFFIEPELMAGLPIAGEDGTLRKRMREDGIRGRVRAKTGTMTGVTSLAGYVKAKSGHVYSFVILINGFSDPVDKYRKLQDDICRAIIRLG